MELKLINGWMEMFYFDKQQKSNTLPGNYIFFPNDPDKTIHLHKTWCAEELTTPIIHEHHAKDMFMCFFNWNRFSKFALSSHKKCLIEKKEKERQNKRKCAMFH